jgi:hypothetical protein
MEYEHLLQLVHYLSTKQYHQMVWLISELAVKLWYGVFGGGAKKPKPNPSTSSLSSSRK